MCAWFIDDRYDEEYTATAIRSVLRETSTMVDPHTAVALAVAEKEIRDRSVPMVVLSTAHAAKFPDAVEAACGLRPALPEWLSDLESRTERITALPSDQAAVEHFILGVSRAAREGAAA
jgi:threonine synthase